MSVPECLLVNLVVNNCREEIVNTTDWGPVTATSNFGSAGCVAAGVTDAITPCSAASPGNLSLSCTVTDPTCTLLGSSPDPLNPTVSDVVFQLGWTETIVGSVGTLSCTVTHSVTQDVLVQLATSTVSQPVTYTCTLVNEPICECRLVFFSADETCHLVCTAAFCVEFEAITPVKRLVLTSPCPVVSCDPFPSDPCATV